MNENADQNTRTDWVIAQMTEHQTRLGAYINAALGEYFSAQDVLQKTNLAIWKKAKEFQPGAEFLPWAIGIARYEILAYYRDRGRDRLVFSPEISDMLANLAEKRLSRISERQIALRECLKQLPNHSRRIIDIRYGENRSLNEISENLGKTVPSIKMLLLRLRASLAKCVEWRLKDAISS
jgi:RNA polymerase sigma-70 factor (ECF subfamily)